MVEPVDVGHRGELDVFDPCPWALGARGRHPRRAGARRTGRAPAGVEGVLRGAQHRFFRLYVQRRPFTRFKRMFRTLAKLFAQIVSREDDKVAKLAAYARGLFDGLTGRLGLRMPLR